MRERGGQFDYIIVGGGVLGCAVGYLLSTRTEAPQRVAILEKESSLAAHQTGRNSGVIHSGIYYKPGSLKARMCLEGKLLLEAFCQRHAIPFERCGKVIVAVDEKELPALTAIHERGSKNGVACEIIDDVALHALEPHVQGIRAIHVPMTGIVNYRHITEKFAECIRQAGGEVRLGTRVETVYERTDSLLVETNGGAVEGRMLINCAGLQSDRLAIACGLQPEIRIVPFRGEYFELTHEAHHLCRNLIYPVPNPNFPFLGVHFTRMIAGGVECGPNAVFAFGREAYTKCGFNLLDFANALAYPGLWSFAVRHWQTACGEMWRSLSKGAFVRALQRLVPGIRAEHLIPAEPGIRAQALSRDGRLVDDFVIQKTRRSIHVLNAPSPAATASLAIAEHIVRMV